MEKVTQKEMFNEIIEVATKVGREDIVEFAQGRLELLDKKTASRKPSKAQLVNESIKAQIVAVLEKATAPMTCTEIQKALDIASLNKAVALVTQLVKADEINREEVKGKPYFSAKTEGVEVKIVLEGADSGSAEDMAEIDEEEGLECEECSEE